MENPHSTIACPYTRPSTGRSTTFRLRLDPSVQSPPPKVDQRPFSARIPRIQPVYHPSVEHRVTPRRKNPWYGQEVFEGGGGLERNRMSANSWDGSGDLLSGRRDLLRRDLLSGHELDGNELVGNELDGNELSGHELDGNELDGNELSGHELSGYESGNVSGQRQKAKRNLRPKSMGGKRVGDSKMLEGNPPSKRAASANILSKRAASANILSNRGQRLEGRNVSRPMSALSRETATVNVMVSQWVNSALVEEEEEEFEEQIKQLQALVATKTTKTVDTEATDENDTVQQTVQEIEKKIQAYNRRKDGLKPKKEPKIRVKKRKKRREGRMSVEKRIEQIKSDKFQMRLFKEKIAKYHKQDRKNRVSSLEGNLNFVQRNVEETQHRYFTPRGLKTMQKKRIQSQIQHQEVVWHNYSIQRKERQQRLENQWEEVVQKQEYAEYKRMILPLIKKREKRLKMWLPSLINANFCNILLAKMISERKRVEHERRVNRSLKILRLHLLPLILKRREKRESLAKQEIKKNMVQWILSHRIRKKRLSVQVITSCLSSLELSTRFSKHVTMYLHHVKTCQAAMRNHARKRNAQVDLLTAYWEKVEEKFMEKLKIQDQNEYRERILHQIEHLSSLVQGNIVSSDKSTSVKLSMKKTKGIVVQTKKLLKKIIDIAVPKPQKNIMANLPQLLEMFQTKAVSPEVQEKVGHALGIYPRERFKVLSNVRHKLIKDDLVHRLKDHRHFVRHYLKNNPSYFDKPPPSPDPLFFRIIPTDASYFENLILQGQEQSKKQWQSKNVTPMTPVDEEKTTKSAAKSTSASKKKSKKKKK